MFRLRTYQKRFRKASSFNAYSALSGKANGFVLDVLNDTVLVKDTTTAANNFIGTMAEALSAGILVYSSPSTKYVMDSFGVLQAGTTLRCHHSGAGVPQGILSEPQRTNLLTYSNTFSNAGWSKTEITATAASATGPDGNQSMWLMTGTGAVDRMIAPAATIAASTTYCASFVCKRGNHDWIAIYAASGTGLTNTARSWFNLNTGAVGSIVSAGTGWTAVSRSIEDMGGGLYRCTLAFQTTGTSVNVSVAPASANSSLNKPNLGSGEGIGTEFYVGFAQLEAGVYPTSIIVTAASAVTRAADDLYVDLSKVPFSATVGTVVVHAQPTTNDATGLTATLINVDAGTSNERITMQNNSAGQQGLRWTMAVGGVQNVAFGAAGAAATAFKAAMTWQENDVEGVSSGVSRSIDTSNAIPTGLAYLRIGSGATAVNHWSSPIGFVALIPERLSQADMIARTS